MRHALAEEGAVAEPCQRVVERLVGKLVLECAALGHVPGGEHDASDVLDGEQVVEDALEPDDAAVLAP